MRTLRPSLAGTVILVLLGALPTGMAAQDPTKATWTHITGTAREEEWIGDTPGDSAHRWDGSVEYMPATSASYTVEWSDPRLPTTMHIGLEMTVHHGVLASYGDWMIMYTIAARLDGPDGALTGSGTGVFGTDGDQGQMALASEGADGGLSAVLDITWTGEDYTVLEFDGWILESALPSMPEPVEPTSASD